MDKRIEIFKKFVNPAVYESEKEDCGICAKCAKMRPVCCQCLPCHISPHDLKDLSYEGLIEFIDSGIVSIDWFHGGLENTRIPELRSPGTFFYLRMKAKEREVVDPAMGMSCCILWDKDKGCPLDFCHRPKGARELIPREGFTNCIENYQKDECAFEWLQYNQLLEKVANYYIERGHMELHDPISMLLNIIQLTEIVDAQL